MKDPMPLGLAVFLLIVGVLLGSVFTFGIQHWNAEVTPGDCVTVETQFLDYSVVRKSKKSMQIAEIHIDCANQERYFIDGACVNTKLRSVLADLSTGENIKLQIHPNSSTIVAFSTETSVLLEFEDTIGKLRGEATGFLVLGIFTYLCAVLGLYHIVLNINQHD